MKLEDLNLTERERNTIQPLNDSALCEAAMCLWEVILDHFRRDEDDDHADVAEEIKAMCKAVGTATLRWHVMGLADACHVGFYVGQVNGHADAEAAFDWDWCPWFVANCIDWSMGVQGAPMLRADWIEVIRNAGMVAAIEANFEATHEDDVITVAVTPEQLRLIVDALAIINPDEADDEEAARQLGLRLERELA